MTRAVFLPVLVFVLVLRVTAGDGSNLGGQATHYEPPMLAGSITFGIDPIDGARLTAVSGQHTVSDPSGAYLVALDAAGIYRVTARSVLNSATKTVETFTSQTVTLDFDLGTACSVTGWPDMERVLEMVTCINGNQNESID